MAARSTISSPRSILLATDLTPACDRAFDRAIQLTLDWNASLTVCHVIEASSLRPWGIERRVKNAETELERLVAPSRETLKTRLSSHIVVGDPAERTLEHARGIGSEFVITGPAHGKILGDKLLGSTAARIVRHTHQPVLAVRRRQEGPYGTVAVGVDFSAPSEAAYRCARALFPRARFALVHAYGVSPDYGGRNEDKSMDVVEAEEKARVARLAEQHMADLVGEERRQVQINTVLEQGSAESVMIDYVDRHWPDLVVTGTRGQGAARTALIGSVTEGLLRSLPCDVLAVPAGT